MKTHEHGKIATLVEGVAESATACLVMMVQGNMLAITLGHLAIAGETGVIASVMASIVVLVSRAKMRWIFSVSLGLATAVADFSVHPGQFGPVFAEALVTGLGAGILSFLLGMAIQRIQEHR